MYVVRNVFRTKPGKAKDLVAKFKAAAPHFKSVGGGEMRILTDSVAGFWTVVIESEVDDFSTFTKSADQMGQNAGLREAMAGYMDLVEGGYREVFRIE